MQTPPWRDRIRYVAIDMCTVFAAAIRRYMPNATIVVDHFHVVKLANDTVAEVRRRTIHQPACGFAAHPLGGLLRVSVAHSRGWS